MPALSLSTFGIFSMFSLVFLYLKFDYILIKEGSLLALFSVLNVSCVWIGIVFF